LFLCACFGPAAHAALRTGTGAGANGSWSTAANWSPSGTPQNGEDLAFPGNAQLRQFLSLNGLPVGEWIFWSVQAVDGALAGGPFAAEASFAIGPQLSITGSGTAVTISWAPPTPGFVLQESSDLSPIGWSNSPGGAGHPITIPTAGSARFSRLFKP
jgi:hypothetical protein